MDDVVNVVKDANTHDFITKLPDGYESQVSCLFFNKKILLNSFQKHFIKILMERNSNSVSDKGGAFHKAAVGCSPGRIKKKLNNLFSLNLLK